MSKCDLRIEFDRPDRTYVAGSDIVGVLVVRANQAIRCKAIKLTGFWETHGKGNKDKGDVVERILFQGELAQGQEQRFPFSVPAAAWPVTYRGNFLNIDHYIEAKVEIGWLGNPSVREEALVVPGPLTPQASLAHKTAAAGSQSAWVGVIVGSIFGAVLFAVAAGLILGAKNWFGLCPLIIGVFAFAAGFWNVVAASKLGKVEATLDAPAVARGGVVPLRLRFAPPKALKLASVKLIVVGRERVVSGSGTNATTHSHIFHTQEIALLGACDLPPGEPVELQAHPAIPPDAPGSFSSPSNHVEWMATIKVAIPSWPDWSRELPVKVVAADVQTLNLISAPGTVGIAATATQAGLATPHQPQAERYERATLETSEPAMESERITRITESSRLAQAERTHDMDAGPEDQEEAELEPIADAERLAALCERLANDPDRRTGLIQRHAAQAFRFELEVEHVQPTLALGIEGEYVGGKTVAGRLHGHGSALRARFPADMNDAIVGFREGDRIAIEEGLVAAWNPMDQCVEIEA